MGDEILAMSTSTTTISFAQLRDSALEFGMWRPLPTSPDFSSTSSTMTAKPYHSSPLLSHSHGLHPLTNAPFTRPLVMDKNTHATTPLSTEMRDNGASLAQEINAMPRSFKRDAAPDTTTVHEAEKRAKRGSERATAIRAPDHFDPLAPAATRLRYIIKHSPTILTCPGVYDGLSARVAINMGFEGLYMTGAGTTASVLGAADLGLAQLHDMRTNADMIANLTPDGPPLIADMDTGYGGPMVIARAVAQYVRAGVAGFHIEDQVPQKRCGHLQGKEVVDADTFIQRIRACRLAADQLRSDIVVIARTDALQSRGYDECLRRLRRARLEGADMGILEGCVSRSQAAQVVRDLHPWPLCLNSVENGMSPLITVADAQEMGYRAVIFSFATISPAYEAIQRTLEHLKATGATGSKITPKQIFEVCGLRESMEVDANAGGSAFAKGV